MTKTCEKCLEVRADEDFYSGNICYRCIFAAKIAAKKKGPIRRKDCKQCGTVLDSSRWTYCSDHCSKLSKRKMDSNSWFRKIKTPVFGARFSYGANNENEDDLGAPSF